MPIDPNDKRWGGYFPWFFRHGDFDATGNFLLFFERLSQRLYRLFFYNEFGIQNLNHFGEMLESKSLQRFRFEYKSEYGNSSLAYNIRNFFNPKNLKFEMEVSLREDPEYKSVQNRPDVGPKGIKDLQFLHSMRGLTIPNSKLDAAGKKILADYIKKRQEFTGKRQPILEQKYYQPLFIQRLGVLEALLTILSKESSWLNDLISDIRRFFAEAQLMLDINPNSHLIELLEEPLLQKEVISNLLPRLASKYPERASEFIRAYHDMIGGKKFDEIFIEAFKTLEELARSITANKKFQFTDADLVRHFPKLHKTIHATIIKMYAHRGDKAGHAKSAPAPHEMRYLLFSIINIALLLLDYEA